ncbi:hypothetical protein BC739_007780 [Kutzneria viridogrisea]|uniref:Uncharacterized protein n=2 Tax=Kutzneria TaxID=43356 RepID=W5WH79_9PSEU|nr:hypothetical protein [Kutzneria albida]AHH97529.1 hypothetical protein KALB_4165 [Kutzneria albida DSM 43870]MBA8930533.1 hypothetical protein [Kutzneria viridogrisea]
MNQRKIENVMTADVATVQEGPSHKDIVRVGIAGVVATRLGT